MLEFRLKFVPKGRINNIPALVQIMAWHRPGDKALSEAMTVNSPTHIYASFGLNELTSKMLNRPKVNILIWHLTPVSISQNVSYLGEEMHQHGYFKNSIFVEK